MGDTEDRVLRIKFVGDFSDIDRGMDARLRRTERQIASDDFFQDLFTTAMTPGEVLTEIRLPYLPALSGSAYEKLANRASHYALAGCAAVVTLNAGRICTQARIVITGASVKPTRAIAVEDALTGKILDEAALVAAAEHAADGLELLEDIHGSAAYRARMARVMTKRALTRALARA